VQVVNESIEIELLDFPEVPSNKENFDDIFRRLKLVEDALRLRPAVEATKGFLARKWEWVINHKGTSVILGIVFCLASVFDGAYFKYYLDHKDEGFNTAVDKRIRLELEKPDGVLKTLQNIQQTVNRTDTKLNTLEPFIQDLIRHQFESASKLPTAELQKRLPAVQHLLAVAKDQHVKADSKVLDVFRHTLEATPPPTPGFWPATAEFISYRSFNGASWFAPANIPICTDSPPSSATIKEVQDEKHMVLNPGVYENCRFDIDSPEQDQKLNSFLIGPIAALSVRFKRCLIVYHGGEINLILALHNFPISWKVTASPPGEGTATISSDHTLEFEDCLFDFDLQGKPPEKGIWLTQYLLANTASKLTISITTHS